MPGDEGREIGMQQVPTIGGTDGISSTATIVASEHVSDAFRANGVAYNENPGVDVTTQPYPQGTAMNDSTPGDDVN